jgi:FkbM family methyltransferase
MSWLSSMLGTLLNKREAISPSVPASETCQLSSEATSPSDISPIHVFEYNGRSIKFECPSEIARQRAKGVLLKEPGTIAWIESFEANSSFWDIGANIGMFSLYAAVFRNARVTSFEPAAPTYATLVRNIAANGLDRTSRALCVAIDDRCHVSDMRMRDDVPGSALHMFGTDTDYTGAIVEPAYHQGALGASIDALVSIFGLSPPDHIKVDVDGLERAVVAGGTATFRHCKSILIELDLNDQAEVDEITATMRTCGLLRDDSIPGNKPRAHPSALVYNMVFRR